MCSHGSEMHTNGHKAVNCGIDEKTAYLEYML